MFSAVRVEALLIIRIVNYALIGTFVGALFPVILWIALFACGHGVARTLEMLRNTVATVRMSGGSELYVKTGALPGGILGLVSAPYLAPIFAGYMWRILGYPGALAQFVEPVQLGAALVGLVAGTLGYFLRVKSSTTDPQ